MKPFEIPRRSPNCALGQEPLQEGDTYYSMLDEGAELKRLDYCAACWEKLKAAGPYWKAKVPPKAQKRQLVDFSRYAFILLKEALKSDNEEEAFVLALYLARKRQLLLRGEKEGFSLYEVAETEEMLAIKKLDLSTLEADKVQDALALKFKNA